MRLENPQEYLALTKLKIQNLLMFLKNMLRIYRIEP